MFNSELQSTLNLKTSSDFGKYYKSNPNLKLLNELIKSKGDLLLFGNGIHNTAPVLNCSEGYFTRNYKYNRTLDSARVAQVAYNKTVVLGESSSNEDGLIIDEELYRTNLIKKEISLMKQGIFPLWGIEIEFYVGKDKESIKRSVDTFEKFYMQEPTDLEKRFSDEVMKRAKENGVPINMTHGESGTGQLEFVMDHSSTVENIENYHITRKIMDEVSKEQGIYFSDSPAPFSQLPSNGTHCNYSLIYNTNEELQEEINSYIDSLEDSTDYRMNYYLIQNFVAKKMSSSKQDFINLFANKDNQVTPLTAVISDEIIDNTNALSSIISSYKNLRRLVDDPVKRSASKTLGCSSLINGEARRRNYVISLPEVDSASKARIELRLPASDSSLELLALGIHNIASKVIDKLNNMTLEDIQDERDKVFKKRTNKWLEKKEEFINMAPNYLFDIIDELPNKKSSFYNDLFKHIKKEINNEGSNVDKMFKYLDDSLNPEIEDYKKYQNLKKSLIENNNLSQESKIHIINNISKLLCYQTIQQNLLALECSEVYNDKTKKHIISNINSNFNNPHPFGVLESKTKRIVDSPLNSPNLLRRKTTTIENFRY